MGEKRIEFQLPQ